MQIPMKSSHVSELCGTAIGPLSRPLVLNCRVVRRCYWPSLASPPTKVCGNCGVVSPLRWTRKEVS